MLYNIFAQIYTLHNWAEWWKIGFGKYMNNYTFEFCKGREVKKATRHQEADIF